MTGESSESFEWPEALVEVIEDFTHAFDASERYEMLYEMAELVD